MHYLHLRLYVFLLTTRYVTMANELYMVMHD